MEASHQWNESTDRSDPTNKDEMTRSKRKQEYQSESMKSMSQSGLDLAI